MPVYALSQRNYNILCSRAFVEGIGVADDTMSKVAVQTGSGLNQTCAKTKAKFLLPPCRVCEDQAAGFHYGANTCEACKGFFHRSLRRKGEYQCLGVGGGCDVKPGKQRSCPRCRYQRCLEAGMSRAAIKTGRYTYVKRNQDALEVQRLEIIAKHKDHLGGSQLNSPGNLNDHYKSSNHMSSHMTQDYSFDRKLVQQHLIGQLHENNVPTFLESLTPLDVKEREMNATMRKSDDVICSPAEENPFVNTIGLSSPSSTTSSSSSSSSSSLKSVNGSERMSSSVDTIEMLDFLDLTDNTISHVAPMNLISEMGEHTSQELQKLISYDSVDKTPWVENDNFLCDLRRVTSCLEPSTENCDISSIDTSSGHQKAEPLLNRPAPKGGRILELLSPVKSEQSNLNTCRIGQNTFQKTVAENSSSINSLSPRNKCSDKTYQQCFIQQSRDNMCSQGKTSTSFVQCYDGGTSHSIFNPTTYKASTSKTDPICTPWNKNFTHSSNQKYTDISHNFQSRDCGLWKKDETGKSIAPEHIGNINMCNETHMPQRYSTFSPNIVGTEFPHLPQTVYRSKSMDDKSLLRKSYYTSTFSSNYNNNNNSSSKNNNGNASCRSKEFVCHQTYPKSTDMVSSTSTSRDVHREFAPRSNTFSHFQKRESPYSSLTLHTSTSWSSTSNASFSPPVVTSSEASCTPSTWMMDSSKTDADTLGPKMVPIPSPVSSPSTFPMVTTLGDLYRCKETVIDELTRSHNRHVLDLNIWFSERNEKMEKPKALLENTSPCHNDAAEESPDAMANWLDTSVRGLVQFARTIPGFSSLPMRDRMTLIKFARLDFNALSLTKSVVWDGFNDLWLMSSGDKRKMAVSNLYRLRERIQRLDLGMEEIVLMKAVVILATDRAVLTDTQPVDGILHQLTSCLLHALDGSHSRPGLVLGRIVSLLVEVRALTAEFLDELKSLGFKAADCHNPLLREMYTGLV